MSDSNRSENRYVSAERALESLLARGSELDTAALDALIAAHPDLEPEIREILGACGQVDRALGVARASELARRAHAERLIAEISAGTSASERYAPEGEIGRGGMGAVFRVRDRRLDRSLAMKVILDQAHADASGGTPSIAPDRLSRFLNEARITGQLDHPGIVPVHEVGIDEQGRAYFTMKLVGGRTLAEVYRRRAAGDAEWSTSKVLTLVQRVCEAVAFAHERGVIHRDLKPANVMVGDFGEVYVMDWGLARRGERARDVEASAEATTADDALSTLVAATRDGQQAGTPAYMSPEQAGGRIGEMGPQSDVYSIGAMLYELIAGHPPYCEPGSASTPAEVLARVIRRPPRGLEHVDAPPELVAICEKAMARETGERYRDVGELSRDLQSFLDGRVVAAYETGAWAEARKWVRRNRALATSLAAAALLLVAGLSASLVFRALAARKAVEAANQARIAETNAAIATRRANDVLSLSAIQDLKNLEDRADALWPAGPDLLPKYDAWLADARELVKGRAADPSRGIEKRPGLADHEAKLAELRQRAKPLSPDEIENDRRANAGFAEWERSRSKLAWMRRMLGDDPWPGEAEVGAAIPADPSNDARAWNRLAWTLVDPDPARIVYGSEVRGLVFARRAVALAGDADRGGTRDTLGWALFRCGRLDEAIAEEERAVGEAAEEHKPEVESSLRTMREQTAKWRDLPSRREDVAKLASRVAELDRAVDRRSTYDFEAREDRWWHAQLAKLVSDLKAFTDEEHGGLFSGGVSEAHGWGIRKRSEFARTIRERSVDGPEARKRWDTAVAAIAANPKYDGLALAPQTGLLPIGEDPDSHLWEFAELSTGDPAVRGSDGKLVLEESTGLVLVLIPGGTFEMGAQQSDPSGPNYDPQARENESPVHEIRLAPYFLSKYEMTQGQWERFTGKNPSNYGPLHWARNTNRNGKGWTALHPVEQVTWLECTATTARLGLALPSEAQWENAARGGTQTVFSTGSDLASLRGAANIADAYGKSHGADAWSSWEADFDDGNTVHAEVGSYRANPYGLHDVHGNVWEWCSDGFDALFYRRSPGVDPVAPIDGVAGRVFRGGSFGEVASIARVAIRGLDAPDYRSNDLGLRPARAITR
jgi:formylglycine-generating enzyme required for sulfatase activity/tRNA A-37 threonylcarbamoyl transferase component Bud32